MHEWFHVTHMLSQSCHASIRLAGKQMAWENLESLIEKMDLPLLLEFILFWPPRSYAQCHPLQLSWREMPRTANPDIRFGVWSHLSSLLKLPSGLMVLFGCERKNLPI